MALVRKFFFSLISALFLAFLAGWAHEDETVSFVFLFDSCIEMFAEGSVRINFQ